MHVCSTIRDMVQRMCGYTFMGVYLISVVKPNAVEVTEKHLFFLKFNIISLAQNVQ